MRAERSRLNTVFLRAGLVAACAAVIGCSGGAGSEPVCGNGVVEGGEQCDVGEAGDTTACSAECEWGGAFTPEPEPWGSSTRPSVSVSEDGYVVIAYQKAESTDVDVHAVVYGPNGSLVAPPFRLNSLTDGAQTSVDVAAGPMGEIVAVWSSGPEMDRDVFVRWFEPSTWQPVSAEAQVNQDSAGDQYDPEVAMLGEGGAVVAWTGLFTDGDGAGVRVRRFGSDGAPLGGEATANTYWENDQKNPSVAAAPDGAHVVAWESKCQEEG